MTQPILLTGGAGFLGGHLARALLEAGHSIRLAGRNLAAAESLITAGATPLALDLRDSAAVINACAGVDIVVHVGALSAPWGPKQEFFETNVGGTQAVIEGCRRHHVRRLIHISSPSVIFDGRDHFNLTEAAPYPKHFLSTYALTKKLAEDQVNAARDLNCIILRPKAIFGPGDRALLPRLIAAARANRLPQIGNGQNLVDLTYVDNVVHAIQLAVQNETVTGTYTITNGEHVRLWAVIRTVLRRLRLNSNLRVIPIPLGLLAAGLLESAATLTGREPTLTRYSAALLARTQTYDITAAQTQLGYAPRVSVADGIERALAAWVHDMNPA
jgi:nucleoside-diphosphate-sugar epimerase